MDKKFLQNIPEVVLDFTKSLKNQGTYEFLPAKDGLTSYGKSLKLGFSCYALKIYYMTGEITNLTNKELSDWTNYIKSFQKNNYKNFSGYFIDPEYVNYYDKTLSKETIVSTTKTILNILPSKNYEIKKVKKAKGINAETKQAIATLKEVGKLDKIHLDLDYKNYNDVEKYLNSLDWSKPWSAGAQFSSFCVYSNLLNLNFEDSLNEYITELVDFETGSYFAKRPINSREVINGAMKVITGLDWIGGEIHHPEKLIDYCLTNKPVLEGCDVVDFIYVLYKCSKQKNYKKMEINELFTELLDAILELFVKKDNAFSYFPGYSQTHYYGVPISKGNESADIHGSLLCLWGILMILDNLELINEKCNIIKP